jgi:hypothetical protein
VSWGRVAVSAGGGGRRGTTGGVGEENCAGRGAGRPAARRAGRGGALEAGEDEAEEDDTTVAEPQRPGSPGQVGEEAARVQGADGGGPAAWQGVRALTDFGRPAAVENTMW